MGGSSGNDTGGGSVGGVASGGGSSQAGMTGSERTAASEARSEKSFGESLSEAREASRSPNDDGGSSNRSNKSETNEPDRAAGPPGIGAPPSSAAPADTAKGPDDADDNRDDRSFVDRVADALSAPPTDAEGNPRSTSPVADRVRNHTVNYSLDDLKNVFTDDPGLTPEQSQALAEGAAVIDGVAISEEYCTIEVRSKTISGVGPVEAGPFAQPAHAYVVTTDSVPRPDAYLGDVTVHRGGPEANERRPVDESPFGDIVTTSEEYGPGTDDWTTEERPTVTVAAFPGNCDLYDRALEKAGKEIESERHDYDPLGPNSNTVVTEMLERANLPAPDDYPGWTPGSKMDLSGDDPHRRPDPWDQPMP